jgi:hypothetical protein
MKARYTIIRFVNSTSPVFRTSTLWLYYSLIEQNDTEYLNFFCKEDAQKNVRHEEQVIICVHNIRKL